MNNKLNNQGIRFAVKAGIASALVLALPALAQNPAPTRMEQDKPSDNKPSGIPWGPVTAYPEVDATFKANDNIYQRPSSQLRRSDHIFVVAPKLKIEALDGPNTYNLTYRIEDGTYLATSSANYTDHSLSASGKWVFSGRAGLKVDLAYAKMHEDQSNTPGLTIHAKPDRYDQTSWNALYGYGAEGAQGRFELDVGQVDKRYSNYRDDGTAAAVPENSKRDHNDTKLGGTFFWRVAPKTQLVAQVVQTKYDYKENSFVGWTAPDSTERRLLVGVTWEATANTTGIFKVGSIKKDFDSAALNDFSKAGWEGTIKWSPLTYSTVDFTSSRLPSEASFGNLSSDTKHGINWNHAWNSRFSTVASYNYTGMDFVGNAGVLQTDKLNAYGLKLNYQWMRTIKLGAGYDRTDKTSSNPASEYKKNLWSVFVNAAI